MTRSPWNRDEEPLRAGDLSTALFRQRIIKPMGLKMRRGKTLLRDGPRRNVTWVIGIRELRPDDAAESWRRGWGLWRDKCATTERNGT